MLTVSLKQENVLFPFVPWIRKLLSSDICQTNLKLFNIMSMAHRMFIQIRPPYEHCLIYCGFMSYSTQKRSGLVTSYDIRPGNGEGLFRFRRFINFSLTYLDTYPLTYNPGSHMGQQINYKNPYMNLSYYSKVITN